jgi:hypothetical protein
MADAFGHLSRIHRKRLVCCRRDPLMAMAGLVAMADQVATLTEECTCIPASVIHQHDRSGGWLRRSSERQARVVSAEGLHGAHERWSRRTHTRVGCASLQRLRAADCATQDVAFPSATHDGKRRRRAPSLTAGRAVRSRRPGCSGTGVPGARLEPADAAPPAKGTASRKTRGRRSDVTSHAGATLLFAPEQPGARLAGASDLERGRNACPAERASRQATVWPRTELAERRPRSLLAYTRGIGGSWDCESRHDGHTACVKR